MRYRFGLTAADWAFFVALDGLTPQLAAASQLTLWNQASGGTQYTDLALAADGSEPITFVTSSDGSDGYITGTVGEFWGPDNIVEMFIDGGAGGRLRILATNIGPLVVAQQSTIDDLENRVGNLENLSSLFLIAWYANPDGSWDPRPPAAGARPVVWVGPATPPAGGTPEYMRDGDLYIDTVP